MKTKKKATFAIILLDAVLLALAALPAGAQPPYYPPPELERLVARVALYPDSLLSQILAAATYPDQIPDAAGWAD